MVATDEAPMVRKTVVGDEVRVRCTIGSYQGTIRPTAVAGDHRILPGKNHLKWYLTSPSQRPREMVLAPPSQKLLEMVLGFSQSKTT